MEFPKSANMKPSGRESWMKTREQKVVTCCSKSPVLREYGGPDLIKDLELVAAVAIRVFSA